MAQGLEGVHWQRCNTDGPSAGPVLSIIELKLRDGVDVEDDAQPGAQLWNITLEYLRRLPRLMVIYWGLDIVASNTLFLFIQWESVVGWQTFQGSLGVTMMLGLVVEPPNNHTLRVCWPECLDEVTQHLEVISFTFPSRTAARELEVFEANWCETAQDPDTDGIVLPSGWIENDAGHGRPSRRASQPRCPMFVGFVAHKDIERKERAPFLEMLLEEYPLTSLTSSRRKFSQVKISLKRDYGGKDKTQLREPITNAGLSIFSTAWLIEMFSLSSYAETGKGTNKCREHLEKMVSQETTRSSDSHVLKPPIPQGAFVSMDDVHSEFCPGQLEARDKPPNPTPGLIAVMFWLEVSPNEVSGDGTMKLALQELDSRINKYLVVQTNEDRGTFGWFVDLNSPTKAFLNITQRLDSVQPSFSQDIQEMLDSPTVSTHIGVKSLRCSTLDVQYSSNRLSERSLEVTSFYLPAKTVDKRLFEQRYHDYACTMDSTCGDAWSSEGTASAERWMLGWQRDSVMRFGQEMVCYVAITAWRLDKDEWYLTYAKSTDYEGVGHKVDVLRILASGGVESQLFRPIEEAHFDEEDCEMDWEHLPRAEAFPGLALRTRQI